MTRVADVVSALERAYPPRLAADWDAVGLVCGDPADPVERVLVAVDPVPETVDEVLETGAQLLVTHHPLLLRGIHSVATTGAKGAAVTALVVHDIALYVAGGVLVGAVALVLAAVHLRRPPPPRALLLASAGLLALVPVTYLLGNLGRLDTVSFALVDANRWPHRLAAVALLLLVVGTARSCRAPDGGRP